VVFVKAALVKDLEPGHMVSVETGGKEIVIANLDGKYYAIGNRCTHMGCLLSDGALKGRSVTCSCHGSVFDIMTGNVLKGPAGKPEPLYQTKIEGEHVMIII
jgi:nitrite reductase/ring-hydroxylating ferredoxin subunit